MQRLLSETPGVFHVNWFRKDADGKFLWPGFGENMRVLKWIVDRVRGRALAKEPPFGWQPRYEDMKWEGLSFPKEQFEELQRVDRDAWRTEIIGHEELSSPFTTTFPRNSSTSASSLFAAFSGGRVKLPIRYFLASLPDRCFARISTLNSISLKCPCTPAA